MSQRAWLTSLASIAVLGAVGCTGPAKYPGGQSSVPTKLGPDGKPGIENAGLPMQVLDARTGHQVDAAGFWTTLATERAVCVGEEHPNPHHHWVQLEVIKHLAAVPHLALGMEMFQRPFQGVLDDFAAGHIDAAALRSRAGWEDRWGYDWNLYGPTIAAVVAAKGTLIALNAPKELTKKVVHHGLEALTPEEHAQVPELNLKDPAHRAWFDALMEDMGCTAAHSSGPAPAASPVASPHHTDGDGGEAAAPAMPSADAIYTVQVIWDETMADTSAKWLAANPQGHLVILAGNGHCHDSAIVNRIKRRGIANVVSLRTVIDDGEGGVAEALAKPVNDFLVVLTLPASMREHAKPPQ